MTKGAWGFYLKGKEMVTYVDYMYYNSKPTCIGRHMWQFSSWVKKNCHITKAIPMMVTIAESIELVKPWTKPTREEVESCLKCLPWADETTKRLFDDWEDLMRFIRCGPHSYLNGLRYMIDHSSFLEDSLFCQWAYLFNLDSGKLEVYAGNNKNPKAEGRYAKHRSLPEGHECDRGYYGIKLVAECGIEDCSHWSLMGIETAMDIMEHRYVQLF